MSTNAHNPEAFAELCHLARTIEPNLPADLSNHVVRVTLSKQGQWATAHRLSASDLANRQGDGTHESTSDAVS